MFKVLVIIPEPVRNRFGYWYLGFGYWYLGFGYFHLSNHH